MKIKNEYLNEILKETKPDLGDTSVRIYTPKGKDKTSCVEFTIDYNENDFKDDPKVFISENPVNLSKEQRDIMFLYAMDLYLEALESNAEHEKRLSDYEDDGSHLFIG